jgi:adenylate cyclase
MVGSNVAKEVLFSRNVTPGKGKRQNAAILMVDLQDFTRLSHQADPSEVLALLAHYQQLVEPVILKHGGQIDKFMGDGILAHFGAIDPLPAFAAHALTSMEHILHVMDEWNKQRVANHHAPLPCRVSCDVGTVVAGIVGASSKLEFTIIGDPVNIASKLEKHSKKLNARSITSLRAFQVARKQGYSPRETPHMHRDCAIDGISAPLDLVVLSPQRTYHSQKTKLRSRGPSKAAS